MAEGDYINLEHSQDVLARHNAGLSVSGNEVLQAATRQSSSQAVVVAVSDENSQKPQIPRYSTYAITFKMENGKKVPDTLTYKLGADVVLTITYSYDADGDNVGGSYVY